MATFTINVMGIKQGRNIMNLIMQSVRREGKYELKIKSKVEPEDLMANKLVAYKILTRKHIKNHPIKANYYEYNEGEYFAKADLIGAHDFIEEEKKRLNPSYIMKKWNTLSNNALLSGIIGTVVGTLLGSFVTYLITN